MQVRMQGTFQIADQPTRAHNVRRNTDNDAQDIVLPLLSRVNSVTSAHGYTSCYPKKIANKTRDGGQQRPLVGAKAMEAQEDCIVSSSNMALANIEALPEGAKYLLIQLVMQAIRGCVQQRGDCGVKKSPNDELCELWYRN